MTTAVAIVLLALAFVATGLTLAMFLSKESMLGFPSGLFWAILGGYAYTLSAVPWGDWQYYLFFASVAGMLPFCIYGAYALRKSRKAEAKEDEFIDEGKDDTKYIDEDPSDSIRDAFYGEEDDRGNLKSKEEEDVLEEKPKRKKKVRYGEFR